jgi:hypothetical protein
MKENFKLKCEETLKDFKCLLLRYREVKNDVKLFKMFMTRNRNPLWDLSNSSELRTGLKSKRVIESKTKGVDDHFIQRSKAMKNIFFEIDNHPDITVDEFIKVLKKYSSTVELTKEEHGKVTGLSRTRDVLNYQLYSELDIEVDGLQRIMIENNIPF